MNNTVSSTQATIELVGRALGSLLRVGGLELSSSHWLDFVIAGFEEETGNTGPQSSPVRLAGAGARADEATKIKQGAEVERIAADLERSEREAFASELEVARAVYARYPSLVLAAQYPEEFLADLRAAVGSSTYRPSMRCSDWEITEEQRKEFRAHAEAWTRERGTRQHAAPPAIAR